MGIVNAYINKEHLYIELVAVVLYLWTLSHLGNLFDKEFLSHKLRIEQAIVVYMGALERHLLRQ